MQVNPELVINDLLEQNKQMTLQISMMKGAVAQLQEEIHNLKTQGEANDAA